MKNLITNILNFKINYIIKALIISYTIILAGWGMISPIIAIFITENIEGGTIETVGYAMTVYALTKSLLQIPISRILDITKGEYDEWIVLLLGYFLIAVSAFGFTFVNSILSLLLIQVLYGIADALIFPAWNALFTKHIDQKNIATESSIYQTSADISMALSASLGAILVARIGYTNVFYIVAIISLLAAITILPIRRMVVNVNEEKGS